MYDRHIVLSVSIDPNDTGLPGLPAAKTVVGALITYGLIACVAGLVLSCGVWAVASRFSASPHHAERGKQGVLVSCIAAVLIGSAVGLVNFFSAVHLT